MRNDREVRKRFPQRHVVRPRLALCARPLKLRAEHLLGQHADFVPALRKILHRHGDRRFRRRLHLRTCPRQCALDLVNRCGRGHAQWSRRFRMQRIAGDDPSTLSLERCQKSLLLRRTLHEPHEHHRRIAPGSYSRRAVSESIQDLRMIDGRTRFQHRGIRVAPAHECSRIIADGRTKRAAPAFPAVAPTMQERPCFSGERSSAAQIDQRLGSRRIVGDDSRP